MTLPELTPAHGAEPEWTFDLLVPRESAPLVAPWSHHWTLPDGSIWLSFSRHATERLFRFPGLADFVVAGDERSIRCHPRPTTPRNTIRHLLLDQVLPLLLSGTGKTVLHASCVAGPDGAMAFLGLTGSGKSTLAASLSRRGYALVADDCLPVEEAGPELLGIPSYPGLRLWPDVMPDVVPDNRECASVAHYSDKQRLSLRSESSAFCAEPVRLSRVYVLSAPGDSSQPDEITITPLSTRQSVMELLTYSYRLDIADRRCLTRELDSLVRVARLCPLARLAFPRALSRLPEVHAALASHLKGA